MKGTTGLQTPWGDEAKLMVLQSLQQDDLILSRMPQWGALEQQGLVPAGFARQLEALHPLTVKQKLEKIRADPAFFNVLLRLLSASTDRQALQYILAVFYDVCRDDTSLVDALTAAFREAAADGQILPLFLPLLEGGAGGGGNAAGGVGSLQFAKDKAAFLLSEMLARQPENFKADELILRFVARVCEGGFGLSEAGELDCVKNLLKSPRLRLPLWSVAAVSRLVLAKTDPERLAALYPALFCCWLFTYDAEVLAAFHNAGGIVKVCAVLRKTKTEKIVRLCIHTLLNCLGDDDCVEAVIQQDAVQTLTLLEYEKWRDADLYNEIRDGQARLQQKIKLFSSFDRYSRELRTDKLRFSFLHSAKFWKENVLHFEENEFAAIKTVADLLRNDDDVETLAVACHDLGEFAALHPTGKQVLQKLKVKDKIILLIAHSDKRVSTEALLCLQKVMLDKWQKAASVNE